MRMLAGTTKHFVIAAALAAAALSAGCGGGVELEGPGFEALGITSKKDRGDAKVPDRAPLLIPPDRARLPDPQQATAAAPPERWPNDPDVMKKSEESEVARKQKEYEDKGDWSKKAGIEEFDKLMDPMERRGGIFNRKRGEDLSDRYRDSGTYNENN